MATRKDSLGFFWQDVVPVKPPPAEKIKRTPPEPVWELDTYLPGLEEAQGFDVELFTDEELVAACNAGELLLWDIECYYNYWLLALMGVDSNKVIYFELTPHAGFHVEKLKWILESFCLVDFNGNHYDLPIAALALAGKSNAILKIATNQIIVDEVRPQDVLRKNKVKGLKVNHIDLIELSPLGVSLKLAAGRLHAKRMQDLPFVTEKILSPPQIDITRWYCVNDLRNTLVLYRALKPEIVLREKMGAEYNLDLRSKSDAQIAEAVISDGLAKLNNTRPRPPVILPGTVYRYTVPSFLKYKSELMNWTLDQVRRTEFVVSEEGSIGMPFNLKSLKIRIADGVYRMGIGGLHSSESKVMHRADELTMLADIDVESFYPRIIEVLRLFPKHLGVNFLNVFSRIVKQRLDGKHAGNKLIADSLKIVVNGTYGKLGSKWSIMYAPDLMIQVTLTGQLSLLMLIERMEHAGIPIVSANTDGIVLKLPRVRHPEMHAIVDQWQRDTGFKMEETNYNALYSRDVNSYVAVKTDGALKRKGAYGEVTIDKNPAGVIAVEAVLALLTKGVPVTQTIQECRDITKFLCVRTVKGGAVKDGVYLGKAIRWYYGQGQTGEIVYAKSGNMVARSTGAVPLMDLPETFPADVDFEWYIREAEKILVEVGYATKEK